MVLATVCKGWGGGYLTLLQILAAAAARAHPHREGLRYSRSSAPTIALPLQGRSRLQARLTATAGGCAPAPMTPPQQPQQLRLQLPGPAQSRCAQ